MSFSGPPNDPGLPTGIGRSGLLAARPAANGGNGIYFATDDGPNGTTYLDVAGSWQVLGGAQEVAYAEVDTNVALTTAAANVPGLSIGPFTVGSRPIMVEALVPLILTGAAGTAAALNLLEGVTVRSASSSPSSSGTTLYSGPLVAQYRCAANSGARSFVVSMQTGSGTATAVGLQPAPLILRAWQV